MGGEREVAHLARQLVGDLGREDLARQARRVLALVIEDLVLRDDLAYREGLLAEDADGELTAGQEALQHHIAIRRQGERHRVVQALPLLEQRETHRRAAVRRLDDQRQAEVVDRVGEHRPHAPVGGRDPRRHELALGDLLVHRHAAAQRAAAGIAQAAQLEQGLHGAPLALQAVQHQKDQVGGAHLAARHQRRQILLCRQRRELLRRRRFALDRLGEQDLFRRQRQRSAHRVDHRDLVTESP